MIQNKKISELEEKISGLQNELEKVKENKKGEIKEKELEGIRDQAEDAVEDSGVSRRKFLKALGGGTAAAGAAALLPGASAFTFKDDKPFKFGNQSSSSSNFEVGTSGNLDLHGNDIKDVGEIGTSSNRVSNIHTKDLQIDPNTKKALTIQDTDNNKTNYTPENGKRYFATDTEKLYIGDGSSWNHVGSTGKNQLLIR